MKPTSQEVGVLFESKGECTQLLGMYERYEKQTAAAGNKLADIIRIQRRISGVEKVILSQSDLRPMLEHFEGPEDPQAIGNRTIREEFARLRSYASSARHNDYRFAQRIDGALAISELAVSANASLEP